MSLASILFRASQAAQGRTPMPDQQFGLPQTGPNPTMPNPARMQWEEEAKKLDEEISKKQAEREKLARAIGSFDPPKVNPAPIRPGAAGLALLGALLSKRPEVARRFIDAAKTREATRVQNETAVANQRLRGMGAESDILADQINNLYRQQGNVISEGRYQQGRQDKIASDRERALEKEAGARQTHAATLLKQYGEAVRLGKEGNIRRAAQVLQALADKYPEDYGSYAPTTDQVEADVDEAKNANRQKAAQQWSIDLDRAAKTYGLINDDLEEGLKAKRKKIAGRYDMSEDELGPIPTAKTLGFQRLEETVRANKAREGETLRNHNLIDVNAKERIRLAAGHLELAKKRVAIAQQNANTYRATSESKAAITGAQKVWDDANKKVIALNAKIAGEKDDAKRESLMAERDYWEGLKTQATMTADDARAIQGVVNQIPGFSNFEIKPFVPEGLPSPSGPIQGRPPASRSGKVTLPPGVKRIN